MDKSNRKWIRVEASDGSGQKCLPAVKNGKNILNKSHTRFSARDQSRRKQAW